MPQITLYHNPRCSRSREALALLEHAGIVPDVKLYLESPPTEAELKHLLAMLGMTARELLRTSEPAFRELNLTNQALTEAQLISAMLEHPHLIQRPIAVREKRAILGRPPEAILELLS
jgi:arsenate reductase